MKKNFTLMLAACTLLCAACQNDDDGLAPPEPLPETPLATVTFGAHTWTTVWAEVKVNYTEDSPSIALSVYGTDPNTWTSQRPEGYQYPFALVTLRGGGTTAQRYDYEADNLDAEYYREGYFDVYGFYEIVLPDEFLVIGDHWLNTFDMDKYPTFLEITKIDAEKMSGVFEGTMFETAVYWHSSMYSPTPALGTQKFLRIEFTDVPIVDVTPGG
jgi:hypothetical protein